MPTDRRIRSYGTEVIFYPRRLTTTAFRKHGGAAPAERGRRDTVPKNFPRLLPHAEEGIAEDVEVVLRRIH